jgi:chromosome partitioning protein
MALDQRTKIIACVHHKGGTGKTTACLNIAGFLEKMDRRVLVVDLDPQANATAGLGIDRRGMDYSLYDVLFEGKDLKEIILDTESGVYLAPSSIDLLVAETRLAQRPDPTGVLSHRLANVTKYFDYILLDVPPGSTMLMMNGIVAADELIVPIDAGIFGVETMDTLRILLNHLEEELGIKSHIMMVLLREFPATLFGKDPTKKLRGMLQEFLAKHHYSDTHLYTIPYSSAIHEAQTKGLPISHDKHTSDVGRMFKKITEDILKQESVAASFEKQDALASSHA